MPDVDNFTSPTSDDRFSSHVETIQVEYEKKVKGYLIVLSNYEAPPQL